MQCGVHRHAWVVGSNDTVIHTWACRSSHNHRIHISPERKRVSEALDAESIGRYSVLRSFLTKKHFLTESRSPFLRYWHMCPREANRERTLDFSTCDSSTLSICPLIHYGKNKVESCHTVPAQVFWGTFSAYQCRQSQFLDFVVWGSSPIKNWFPSAEDLLLSEVRRRAWAWTPHRFLATHCSIWFRTFAQCLWELQRCRPNRSIIS